MKLIPICEPQKIEKGNILVIAGLWSEIGLFASIFSVLEKLGYGVIFLHWNHGDELQNVGEAIDYLKNARIQWDTIEGIIGWSAGGYIAQQIAHKSPHAFIVLIASAHSRKNLFAFTKVSAPLVLKYLWHLLKGHRFFLDREDSKRLLGTQNFVPEQGTRIRQFVWPFYHFTLKSAPPLKDRSVLLAHHVDDNCVPIRVSEQLQRLHGVCGDWFFKGAGGHTNILSDQSFLKFLENKLS